MGLILCLTVNTCSDRKVYIVKPVGGSQGDGIFLAKGVAEVLHNRALYKKQHVVQVLVAHALHSCAVFICLNLPVSLTGILESAFACEQFKGILSCFVDDCAIR